MPLINGRWSPEVKTRLSSWIEEEVRTLSEGERLAVFDFDNTCIHHDIGEAFFHYLVSEMRFSFSPTFFEQIGGGYHAEELKGIVERLLPIPLEERKRDPLYRTYRKRMLEGYYRRLEREGSRATYLWVVSIMVGMKEEDLLTACDEVIEKELKEPIGEEEVTTDPQDREPLRIKKGIQLYPEIRELISLLRKIGFTLWVVSASNRWIIGQILKRLNLSVDHFIALDVAVEEGRLTTRFVKPEPIGEGKWEAISKEVGQRPVFVAGDSPSDYAMLEQATEIPLFIDHGRPGCAEYAKKKGWLVQPAFL